MKGSASRAVAFLAVTLIGAGFVAAAFAADDSAATMNAEIDYLLQSVAGSDCVFIRNGKEHDAFSARDHLQTKRKRGRRYFSSADEFIERLASSSSWSGKDYMIRCGDTSQTAYAWFTAALVRYRSDAPRRSD